MSANQVSVRGRRTGQPPVRETIAGITHVTSAGANIFAELGFEPGMAENLRVRAQLMMELRQMLEGIPQADAAAALGISQPRVSQLMRGKIGLFTIDTLVNMLSHAGVQLQVSVKTAPLV